MLSAAGHNYNRGSDNIKLCSSYHVSLSVDKGSKQRTKLEPATCTFVELLEQNERMQEESNNKTDIPPYIPMER